MVVPAFNNSVNSSEHKEKTLIFPNIMSEPCTSGTDPKKQETYKESRLLFGTIY